MPRWPCRNCGSGFLRISRMARSHHCGIISKPVVVRYAPWEGLNEEITLKEISTGISVRRLATFVNRFGLFKIKQELEWPRK